MIPYGKRSQSRCEQYKHVYYVSARQWRLVASLMVYDNCKCPSAFCLS